MSRDFTDKITEPISPYGDVATAEITPDVHLQFPYNINAAQVYSRANQSGVVDQNADMARLQSGAAAI